MSMLRKIMGLRSPGDTVKYSSSTTRFSSLHGFMGGAEIEERYGDWDVNQVTQPELDLESRFNSGVNRTDCPRMWGHASVERRLANRTLSVSNEVRAWRRNKGEPL